MTRPNSSRRARSGSALWKLLLVALLWVVVPLGIAEVGVRLWRPGFPGYRLPQVEHLPVEGYGFGLKPDQEAFNVASPVTVNAAGFRGPELRPTDGHLRVLCAGDSFTFGYGVADDETYPRQLETLLRERWPGRDPEVVNMGAQGYATYHEMDLLRLRGLALQPDAVVLAIYQNDLLPRPEGDYAAEYREEFEKARGSFRHRHPHVYAALHRSAFLTLVTQLYRARQHGAAQAAHADATEADAAWASLERELARFRDLAAEHGFVPLIVVIPPRSQVLSPGSGERYPDEVLAIASRLGLDAIDLRPVLSGSIERGVDPYLAWDHHHGPAGNRLLAEVVYERLAPLLEERAER